jgi:hypothetical protein
VALAREVDARVVLVEADADVRIRLVVAQPYVVDRAVALDELLLGEQCLGLGLGGDELDVADLRDHRRPRLAEVTGDPLLDAERLADVEDLALGVAEQVDAGGIRQRSALLLQPLLAALDLGRGHSDRGYAAAKLAFALARARAVPLPALPKLSQDPRPDDHGRSHPPARQQVPGENRDKDGPP